MDARTRLSQLAVSPTGFVFDPRTGGTFTVNPTGRVILEGIRDGQDLAAVARALADRFDAESADLQRDVLEYVRLLRQGGLLPPDFELR